MSGLPPSPSLFLSGRCAGPLGGSQTLPRWHPYLSAPFGTPWASMSPRDTHCRIHNMMWTKLSPVCHRRSWMYLALRTIAALSAELGQLAGYDHFAQRPVPKVQWSTGALLTMKSVWDFWSGAPRRTWFLPHPASAHRCTSNLIGGDNRPNDIWLNIRYPNTNLLKMECYGSEQDCYLE